MADTQKKRPARSSKWWRKHIESCQESGMSMVEYAKQHDLHLGNFYSWKAKFKTNPEAKERKQTQIIQSNGDTSPSKNLKFVEVSLGQKHTEIVEFSAPNGWSLRFPSEMDPQQIINFIAILEQRR